MSDRYVVEPDLAFIKELGELGGDSLKKCFQCATCSVACPISPGHPALSQKGNDRGKLGIEGQAHRQPRHLALP